METDSKEFKTNGTIRNGMNVEDHVWSAATEWIGREMTLDWIGSRNGHMADMSNECKRNGPLTCWPMLNNQVNHASAKQPGID